MDNQQGAKCCGHGGKIAVMIILIVAIAGICIVSIIRDRIVNYPQWTVSVTGQGKIAYQPDVAKVTLGVQIDKVAKAEDALSQLNTKIKNVVAAIKAAGIDEADITTQNYSLYTQYDYINSVNGGGTSVVSGYNANEQVVIKVTDIINNKDRLNKVIAEANKAGANQVIGIYFEPSNLEDLKQQAKVKAMIDAQAKAQTLASAAGVKLKRVIGWWENTIQAPGVNMGYYDGKGGMGGGSSAAVTPTVPTGNQEIIIEESINYQIK